MPVLITMPLEVRQWFESLLPNGFTGRTVIHWREGSPQEIEEFKRRKLQQS